FSSRRRHTRSYGDWSSDVCSSDLKSRQTLVGQRKTTLLLPDVNIFPSHLDASAGVNLQSNRAVGKSWGGIGKIRNSGSVKSSDRSEERRVGKECRSRRWRER